MAHITKESIVKSIKVILKGADLDCLSAKKIRRTLEAEYNTDFTERKDEIDKVVMKLITSNDSDEEEKKEEKKESKAKQTVTNGSTPAPKRPASPAKNDKVQDDGGLNNDENGDDIEDNDDEEEDDSDLGEIEDVVPKKKAKMQPSSKKNQSPKKMNDEELAKQLQEDEGLLRPSRRCKAQQVVRKQKKPRKESAKGTSVYSRPCALLPPLDEVMGTDKMPRPMIVKRLWEIVKERDLLDPKNKQFMLCDTEMFGLFGKNRVRMFGAMKLLKPYIKDLPKE